MSSTWQDDYFSHSVERVRNNQPLPEDARSADWSYLLPISSERPLKALVIGGGWGTIPIRLTQWYQKVLVVDSESEELSFLQKRKEQGIKGDIEIIDSSNIDSLPIGDQSLDLVCFNHLSKSKKVEIKEALQVANRLLKNDGTIVLNVGNRWSLQSLLRNDQGDEFLIPRSLPYYQRTMARCGFRDVSVYGPIPHHRGIPLFYLPLQNRQGVQHFFKTIFPLLEMVSPESKKAYSLEYSLAKWGVRLGQFLHLTWLSRYLLSGYLIIARKGAS